MSTEWGGTIDPACLETDVGPVVVVGPTHPPKNGGGVQQPILRTPADGIPPSNRLPDTLIDWWPPSIQPAGAQPSREPSTNP